MKMNCLVNSFVASAIFAGAAIFCTSCQKNELGKSAETIKKLNTDFYYMTVTSDAGFSDFIDRGGASSPDELAAFLTEYLSSGPYGKLGVKVGSGDFACSALRAADKLGTTISGRNFDWDPCTGMIIRNIPGNGQYSSISTVNMDFLGFGDGYKPTGLINSFKAVAGVFVPLDGINEKGLVVADLMAGDKEVTDQRSSRPDLTTTGAVRLLLNRAADVGEAVDLLKRFDMHSDIGSAHHLFVADAKGESVAIEWVNNEMIVTPSKVLNNHYLCEQKKGTGSGPLSWQHEASLLKSWDECGGVMGAEEMADAMFAAVELPDQGGFGGTQWTVVYDSKEMSATYYYRRDRAKSYTFFADNDLQVFKGM